MSPEKRVWRSQGSILSTIGLIVVDSELAKESNIDGVQEMLNGCLCCTLVRSWKIITYKKVGRMGDALLELRGLPI